MRAIAKGHVLIGAAVRFKFEGLVKHILVAIARGIHEHDRMPRLQLLAPQLEFLRDTPHQELRRHVVAQTLSQRLGNQAGVGRQLGSLIGMLLEARERRGHDLREGVRSANQQQQQVLPDDIVGRHFKKGELVARIDPRDYEVGLENAQGQLARAEAALQRASDDYDREQRVFSKDPGATSEAALERKLGSRDTSAADVKALKATVAAAEDNLAYTYLNAPFEGDVVSQYVQNFEHVNARQGIVRR